jgi:hypothetical protein
MPKMPAPLKLQKNETVFRNRRHREVCLRYSLAELIGGGAAMVNAMLDARQGGDSYHRVEVITGQHRRRRRTGEEKARIVAESFEEGANISEVARRNGVARGLLTATPGCGGGSWPGVELRANPNWC